MIRYLARRLLGWLAIVVLATNLTYFLAWLYLDPRSNYVGRRPPITEQQIVALLEPRNLSDTVPLIERWWSWVVGIVTRWDWGTSPTGQSVNEQVAYRIGVSTELVLGATIATAVIGVAIGVYTAARQYRLADRIGQATSIVTLNIPVVVAALALVLIAININEAVGTRIFYVTGASSPGVTGFLPTIIDKIQHLILPVVGIVLTSYAGYHFLQRSLLLDSINSDFVRTARAKGLTKSQAIRKHALRTSLIPVVTQVAFSIPAALTGAILTESIFAWNGMGQYFTQTIAQNDIHGTVAIAAFGALMTFVGAMLADVAVVILDPRVRVS